MTAPGASLGGVSTTGRLLSVNVGRPRDVDTGKRVVSTAIWKQPIDGRVAVRGVNVEGDDQADRTVHGGPDKAVYAYAIEDTRAWAGALERELRPGAFGENLTVEGIDVTGALVGERWAIGTTVLEVVQPRLPCFKLGIRFGDPRMVRAFGEMGWPGAYLRIVQEGEIGAGDAIEVRDKPDHGVTMALMSAAILKDRSLLPSLLEAPQLIPMWREWIDEYAA